MNLVISVLIILFMAIKGAFEGDESAQKMLLYFGVGIFIFFFLGMAAS